MIVYPLHDVLPGRLQTAAGPIAFIAPHAHASAPCRRPHLLCLPHRPTRIDNVYFVSARGRAWFLRKLL